MNVPVQEPGKETAAVGKSAKAATLRLSLTVGFMKSHRSVCRNKTQTKHLWVHECSPLRLMCLYRNSELLAVFKTAEIPRR